ncbi:MAG: hypothetical protein QFC55_02755, partial [Chloroflexota bacterium]|nr:hypothetical protein [Chloroflexota bacterium]
QAARPIYEQLLAEARAADDMQIVPRAISAIAESASEDGRHGEALALLEEAYRIDREYGDPSEVIHDLIYFARSTALAGRAELTAKLLGAAAAKQDELGIVVPDWVVKLRESAESPAREQIGDEVYEVAWRAGGRLSPEQAVELTLHEVGQDA